MRIVQAHRQWQALLALLLVVVCCLAVLPVPPRELTTGWDKLNHVLAFASLAFSACLGFSRRSVWVVFLGLLALGGLIEVVQAVVPGRSSEWQDLYADLIGVGVGIVLARLLQRATGALR